MLSDLRSLVLLALLTAWFFGSARVGSADCPPSPTTDSETGRIEGLAHDPQENAARDSSVAITSDGQFIIAYVTPIHFVEPNHNVNELYFIRFDTNGTCICDTENGDCCPAVLSDPEEFATYEHVSVATRSGVEQLLPRVGVGVRVARNSCFGANCPAATALDFELFPESAPFCFCTGNAPCITPNPNANGDDVFPSVGIGRPDADVVCMAWGRATLEPHGLLYALPMPPFDPIRTCTTIEEQCYLTGDEAKWQPCVAMAQDGRFVIAFADSEDIEDDFPPFNIRIRQYDASGTPVGDEVLVDDPSSEVENSLQYSPAVAFDGDNIIVVWVGFQLLDCGAPTFRIFARRFLWNPDEPGLGPVPVSGQFIVDSDSDWAPVGLESGNPTVALTNTTNPCLKGAFAVAWNAKNVGGAGGELGDRAVRIQFFGRHGQTRGREFQAHVQSFDTDGVEDGGDLPYLAESAQHTLAYGPDRQAVLTWTVTGSDPANDPPRVFFTIIPESYVATLDSADPCIKGDLDGNGLVDGRDIQPFVDLLGDSPMNRTPL